MAPGYLNLKLAGAAWGAGPPRPTQPGGRYPAVPAPRRPAPLRLLGPRPAHAHPAPPLRLVDAAGPAPAPWQKRGNFGLTSLGYSAGP